jgi:prepilin-type N-terminal cleavage/methylation domain-containing protein
MRRRRTGYSLVELLVVVSIIGLVSLVAVPNFISMRRANSLRSSLRNFATDMRGTRGRAVTTYSQWKISFRTGTTAREYTVWQDVGGTWVQRGATRRLEDGCYILDQRRFPDRNSDGTNDIIFRQNGTPLLDAGETFGRVLVATTWNLPTSQYTIGMNFVGTVKSDKGNVLDRAIF